MKQNATDITVVLDRSGSMSAIRTDTIGGFNTFLAEQKAVPGEAKLTLSQFDHEFQTVHNAKNISDVPPLNDETFVPRGNTALLDAIGRSINETGKRLGDTPETDRPGKIVFVIVTDGEENASKEFTAAKINEMIDHQRDVYKWQFVFLAANQDAIKTAATLGIGASNSMTYAHNSVGTKAALHATSSNLRNYRTGQATDMSYTDQDRKDQAAAGVK